MKGRPFLGMISGFFFGLFGGIALFLFGVIPLDSNLLWILPIGGVVLGLLMATWAPFGTGRTDPEPPGTIEDPAIGHDDPPSPQPEPLDT